MAVSTFFIIMGLCFLGGLVMGLALPLALRGLRYLWQQWRWVKPVLKPYKY